MNTLEVEVRSILLREWDPIGVNGVPGAQDEYDIYVNCICKMLRYGRSAAEICSHLQWIEIERMGLSNSDKQHTQRIAARLIGLL